MRLNSMMAAVGVVALAVLANAAHASTVTYELKGTTTYGFLGGATYTGGYDIIGTGETSNITTLPVPPFDPQTYDNGNLFPYLFTPPLNIVIKLDGLGTFDVTGTNGGYFFYDQNDQIGGFGTNSGDFMDFVSSLGSAYALDVDVATTSVSPYSPMQVVSTSGGQLVFDRASNSAVFSSVVATVPEPGIWAMLILGLTMVGFETRRRQAGAVAATV